MIELTESDVFGKGNHRICYRHPDDKDLCIKVVFDPTLLKREAVREENYYRHLQKRKISWDMVSKYHGKFETTMGVGAVFDLITDHDGQVSKTMTHYVDSNESTDAELEKVADLLVQLQAYLIKQRIFARLAPRNIVFQKDETGISNAFIIDNIGNTEFIPLGNYFAFIKRKKVTREWNRFIINTRRDFSTRTKFIELFNERV